MKKVEEMSVEECRSELERMENTFACYDRIGQGVSSKEFVRKRALDFKVRMADTISPEAAMRVDDISSFISNGRKLFGIE